MNITTEPRDGQKVIIHLDGRFDLSSAPSVHTAIETLLADGYRWLLVDLAEVSFLDSSALGVLLLGLKQTRDRLGDLRLLHPSEPICYTLEISALDRLLPPYHSLEAALEGL